MSAQDAALGLLERPKTAFAGFYANPGLAFYLDDTELSGGPASKNNLTHSVEVMIACGKLTAHESPLSVGWALVIILCFLCNKSIVL